MCYRIEPTSWHLETAADERERCMFVGDGARCERRTKWLIGSVAALAYAYLCGVHLDFVRQPGEPAAPVEQGGGARSRSGSVVAGSMASWTRG